MVRKMTVKRGVEGGCNKARHILTWIVPNGRFWGYEKLGAICKSSLYLFLSIVVLQLKTISFFDVLCTICFALEVKEARQLPLVATQLYITVVRTFLARQKSIPYVRVNTFRTTL